MTSHWPTHALADAHLAELRRPGSDRSHPARQRITLAAAGEHVDNRPPLSRWRQRMGHTLIEAGLHLIATAG